jgi:hypothetical protein
MKIFGIGMFKTGTTSLEHALKILGFNHINNTEFFDGNSFGFLYRNVKDIVCEYDYESFCDNENNKIKKATELFDAFGDHPWMWCYKKAFDLYPNAKYILTKRKNEESLGNSDWEFWLTNGTKKEDIPPREEFIYRYKTHNDGVRKFFDGHSNFVELCFDNGDGWSELCGFLDMAIPSVDFPHSNKGKYNVSTS